MSSATTTHMAPLSPVHKCVSRKRQRAFHAISDDDEFAAEQLSRDNSEEEEDFDSSDEAATTASGYSSSSSFCVPTKRPRHVRSRMTQEISGMQSSVRVMEQQVAQASASMLELCSLVQQLAAQRQQQQCAAVTALQAI